MLPARPGHEDPRLRPALCVLAIPAPPTTPKRWLPARSSPLSKTRPMAGRPQQLITEVDGQTLKLTNLGKVLYPKAGFTKAEVIDYYLQIAPLLLPHLSDRPLTRKRWPDGTGAAYFFEKNAP